jgi:hypothetical protein
MASFRGEGKARSSRSGISFMTGSPPESFMASRRAQRLFFRSLLAAALATSPTFAQPPAPKLVLEAAEVTPRSASAEALCQLRARIKNTGQEIAAAFVFAVKINGREVSIYRNHMFMDPIEPGETRSLRLYGFWTSETGRQLPAAGDLIVEVSLVEARWMKAAKDAEGTIVWTDLGAVEGLPQTARQTVELTR